MKELSGPDTMRFKLTMPLLQYTLAKVEIFQNLELKKNQNLQLTVWLQIKYVNSSFNG